MFRSLGFESDLLVLKGAAHAEEHPDRVVIRTPSEPTFWYGNMVIFRDPPDPEPQIARFHADFPTAAHVTLLGWDLPGLDRGPAHEALAALGFDIDETDVLALTGPPCRHPAPDGIDIRPLESDSDWDQHLTLQRATGIEEGQTSDAYLAFLEGRRETRRRQIAEGQGIWLGAFDGGLLAADLGILANDRVARFQDVETRASHRRRGICAAMVCAAVYWALARHPGATPVIVALRDSPAGRIYRRCGFSLAETQITAVRGRY